MPRPGVTQEEVQKAVDELQKKGEAVTQIGIRRALGDRGSMSTIRNHLQKIREQMSENRQDAQDVPSELRRKIEDSILGLWNVSQEWARKDIEDIRKAAKTKLDELQTELNALSQAFDEQSDKLGDAFLALQKTQEQLKMAEQKIAKLEAEKAEAEKFNQSLLSRLDNQSETIERILTRNRVDEEITKYDQNKGKKS